ncbi:MAG: 4'-phosphopantetheinyl transferase superfamily protein [Candidatus Rokuibacteriota bacterium]|nr:MAG: 4'-phosphopantetheinyl transferase superfamily protein [Candidatus Rokubacteria bacterium]
MSWAPPMLHAAPRDASTLAWNIPPAELTLAPGEVHVWRADLDAVGDTDVAQLTLLLAPDERARAGRRVHAPDRQRVIVGRAALRMVLARYAGVDAACLTFGRTAAGKPVLTEPPDSALRFSTSHSAGLALCAIVAGREVGVDVERILRGPMEDVVADRTLSPTELSVLRALGPGGRDRAFFAVWTRKEAYAKARGLGLALAFERFSVSAAPDAPALLDAEDDDPRRWTMYDLPAGDGYAAALVVEGAVGRPMCWAWSPAVSAR